MKRTKLPSYLTMFSVLALAALAAPPVVARDANAPQTGSMASGHMSTQGASNTNSPLANDRDTGLNRAEDRMSQQGLAHNQALKKKYRSDHDADDLTKTRQ